MNRKDFFKKSVGTFLSGYLSSQEFSPDLSQSYKEAPEISADRQNPQDVIAVPKSGASISPIGSYDLRPFKGAMDYKIPIGLPEARQLFPDLALIYNISAGNGLFGTGWDLPLQEVKRKTSDSIPQYNGADIFLLSGHEDLIAVSTRGATISGNAFEVLGFKPRVEDLYARIEYWKIRDKPEDTRNFWRLITKENITHFLGYSETTRLINPVNGYTYSWKLEFTCDARGNYIYYKYKKDGELNVILQDIFYGNTTMFTCTGIEDALAKLIKTDPQLCAYKISFDYGQYNSSIKEIGEWEERTDSFSVFRSGFEIRTKRLCKRILVFFLENQEYVAAKSLELNYTADNISQQSILASATFIGHKKTKDNYTRESFPALSFSYTEFLPGSSKFEPLPAKLPDTTQQPDNYTWIDIHANGLPSLVENNPLTGAWSFWKNNGDLGFENKKSFSSAPTGIAMNDSTVQFADFKGNGTADILVKNGGQWKYYESDLHGGWQKPVNFVTAPTESLLTKAYFMDLTGSGNSDALVLTSTGMSFMKCSAQGFENPVNITGTRLNVPSLKHPSIKMADMTGDGLKDIIQIDGNTSEIKYWSNLGYGRFSAELTMRFTSVAPKFNPQDLSNIFFIEVAGTGRASLVFVDSTRRKVFCWLNLHGRAFAEPFSIDIPPTLLSQYMQIQPLDLTGYGSTGLLFSTRAATGRSQWRLRFGDPARPMLLNEVNNNMGLITKFTHESSIFHYLRNGTRDWYFPFPIQVISKIEKIDSVQQTRYCQRFEYFQGYYDSAERELVGFGRVEEYDSEQLDDVTEGYSNGNKESFVPPVKTTTWYHTGREESIQTSGYFNGDSEIDKITISPSLLPNASGEQKRSLRGKKIRMELNVAGAGNAIPYKIEQYNYRLQPYTALSRADIVTAVVSKESVISVYEQNRIDPRVHHTAVIATDLFGNVLTVVSLAYPRRGNPDYAEQKSIYATLNENVYATPIERDDTYLFPGISESFVYRLEGLSAVTDTLIDFLTLQQQLTTVNKELVEQKRTIYWNQDTDAELPKGTMSPHGLIFKTYDHAFTEALLLTAMAGQLPADLLGKDGTLVKEAGFAFEDDIYWRPSMSEVYDPHQFFLPVVKIDPNGARTFISYDKLKLFPEMIRNPLQKQITATYDYAAGKPLSITDINNNKTYFFYNALGLLSSIVHTGKSKDDSDDEDMPSVLFQFELGSIPLKVTKKEKILPGRLDTSYKEEVEYRDGLGRIVTKKIKTENQGTIKWITQGKKIYNNKGDIVEEFAPYFSDTSAFNINGPGQGPSSRNYFDIQGRPVKKVFPDGSFRTISYTAWERIDADENDNDPDSAHFNTPSTSHFDAQGRTFLISQKLTTQETIAEKRILDSKGRPLQIRDALARTSYHYKYDLTGELLYSNNIDKGEEWFITDTARHLIYQKNSVGTKWLQYDQLSRLIKVWEQDQQPKRLSCYTVYGEVHQNAAAGNFNGRKLLQLDKAGLEQYTGYSVKGDLLGITRKFTKGCPVVNDWSQEGQGKYDQIGQSAKLDPTAYTQSIIYNSLSQIIAVTAPDGSRVQYKYNLSGQLINIDITQQGQNFLYLKSLEYNARGQRESMTKGNNCITNYGYSPHTFRLTSLVTTDVHQNKIQDIAYIYDKAGNIEKITDLSQPTIFFKNTKVDPSLTFRYDSLYRLIEASGRKRDNNPFVEQWMGADCNNSNDQAISNYTETYQYDKVGNIRTCTHVSPGQRFVTQYRYKEGSNTLHQISNGNGQLLEQFQYDGSGNTVQMKHLASLHWDGDGRLMQAELGGGGTQFYNYDPEGKRIRTLTKRNNGIIEEKIYLGIFEIFLRYQGTQVTQKTESLIVEAGNEKILILDKKTEGTITRYQMTNHLGSTSVETDEDGTVISYEEFYAFGKTALRFCAASISYKRYRYIGKEQDEDTGFYYIGARYYLPLYGRWISVDPMADKMSAWSPYVYCFNNPVKLFDSQGKEAVDFSNTLLRKEPDFIPQRELEYRFFDLTVNQQKSDVKWPLAAAKVSHAMNEVAHPNLNPVINVGIPDLLLKLVGIDMDPVKNLAERGNRQIFNDAVPKINAMMSGPKLTGLDALKWDAKMLWEEQFLVQPLYDQASKATISLLELGSKQDFPLARLVMMVKGVEISPFPKDGSITDILQRWDYGMGQMYNASFKREGLIPDWFLPPKEKKQDNNSYNTSNKLMPLL